MTYSVYCPPGTDSVPPSAQLQPGMMPTTCQIGSSTCPSGYSCQYTAAINNYICCGTAQTVVTSSQSARTSTGHRINFIQEWFQLVHLASVLMSRMAKLRRVHQVGLVRVLATHANLALQLASIFAAEIHSKQLQVCPFSFTCGKWEQSYFERANIHLYFIRSRNLPGRRNSLHQHFH